MTFEEILIGNDNAKFLEALKMAIEQAKKKEWNETVIKGRFPLESIANAKSQGEYTLIPINVDALSEMINEIDWENRENEKCLN